MSTSAYKLKDFFWEAGEKKAQASLYDFPDIMVKAFIIQLADRFF